MAGNILVLPIIIPLFFGLAALILPRQTGRLRELISVAAALVNLLLAAFLFGKNIVCFYPWPGYGIEFSLRLYHFSAFIMISAAVFAFLISLYSWVFMKGKIYLSQFYAYFLITLSFANGAILADNLVLLLFFWEGLLLTIFGLVAIGGGSGFGVAKKAFIIIGISDLCLMLGIAIAGHLAGTLAISQMHLTLTPLASVAFILMMIGAVAKAGSMPFHSWIPDAATAAPLTFMAFLPAALEKLLGIYLLTRISMDIFRLSADSWLSTLLMTVGALTIIFAVMMALIQKEYKRLLSYHAISQVGYMVLGIGTALPIGIIGGLFHMLNNCVYKSGLFLTAGAVEKQAGTTDLERLGGLRKKMPLTFCCFLITALSISGVPPFNGFFSKELVYHAALERNFIFYLAAVTGSFFTALSFLKLGFAAYSGKLSAQNERVKEAPFSMLVPMAALAVFCILFGLFNRQALAHLFVPVVGEKLAAHHDAGFPVNPKLIAATVAVLCAALAYYLFSARKKGSALHATDYIRYAPLVSQVYSKAEARFFDPYDIGLKIANNFCRICWWLDRGVDWVYNKLVTGIVFALSTRVRLMHTGNYVMYLSWSLAGLFLIMAFFILAH